MLLFTRQNMAATEYEKSTLIPHFKKNVWFEGVIQVLTVVHLRLEIERPMYPNSVRKGWQVRALEQTACPQRWCYD